jgi:hypothetical protein
VEIFFGDDSSQRGDLEGMGQLISFGGLFLAEGNLRSLSDEVDAIAKSFGIPEGTEIKWSPPRDSWIAKNLVGDERKECYQRILEAAAERDGRALVIGWDEGRTSLKGERAFEECVKYALERTSMHLETRGALGIIVADRPGGGRKTDQKLLASFLERVQKGTEFLVPRQVCLNILTTPSHLIRHLQVADLIVGISTAMVAGQMKYAEPLFPIVRRMFITSYWDVVGGTGLKLFPDELVNLYHWLLGESVCNLGGIEKQFQLPDLKRPYAANPYN